MNNFGSYTLHTKLVENLLGKYQPKTVYFHIVEDISIYMPILSGRKTGSSNPDVRGCKSFAQRKMLHHLNNSLKWFFYVAGQHDIIGLFVN